MPSSYGLTVSRIGGIFPRQAAKFTATSRTISQLPIPSAHFALHAALHFSVPEIGETKTFLAPTNGSCLLDPHLVIRRGVKEKEAGLKPLVALLSRDKQLLSRIAFAQGQSRIALEDVLGLPTDLKDGLSGGTYVLSLEDGTESTTFTVASVEERSRVLRRAEEIAGFLGRANPLYLQVAVEHLLTETDDGKKSRRLSGAALRLLEARPWTPRLPISEICTRTYCGDLGCLHRPRSRQ